jgi:hypothetical protein
MWHVTLTKPNQAYTTPAKKYPLYVCARGWCNWLFMSVLHEAGDEESFSNQQLILIKEHFLIKLFAPG